MKKTNRKGFTIVELVIVIAVIAILAGVLIPTFSGVVGNAKESKALQEAKNMYSEYIGTFDYSKGTEPEEKVYVEIDEIIVSIDNGKAEIVTAAPANVKKLTVTDGVYTAE